MGEILAQPYSRILIPQEDGRFSAEILEFPGCFAEGGDPQAAYANLEAAAESWLLACLANGTSVPPPLTNYEVSGRFALRLPKSLYQRAAKAAAREGISLNNYVTTALAQMLGAHDVTAKLGEILSDLKRVAYVLGATPTSRFATLTVDAATLDTKARERKKTRRALQRVDR